MEFDDALWDSIFDFIMVGRDKKAVTFKDGMKITA